MARAYSYVKGQIRKNKYQKPDSTFVTLKIYVRKYADGNSALRVKGYLITGQNGEHTHLRDLDARSLDIMFPFLLFEPEQYDEDEENK